MGESKIGRAIVYAPSCSGKSYYCRSFAEPDVVDFDRLAVVDAMRRLRKLGVISRDEFASVIARYLDQTLPDGAILLTSNRRVFWILVDSMKWDGASAFPGTEMYRTHLAQRKIAISLNQHNYFPGDGDVETAVTWFLSERHEFACRRIMMRDSVAGAVHYVRARRSDKTIVPIDVMRNGPDEENIDE